MQRLRNLAGIAALCASTVVAIGTGGPLAANDQPRTFAGDAAEHRLWGGSSAQSVPKGKTLVTQQEDEWHSAWEAINGGGAIEPLLEGETGVLVVSPWSGTWVYFDIEELDSSSTLLRCHYITLSGAMADNTPSSWAAGILTGDVALEGCH